ncbi:MAG: hypothetical protein K8R85_08655, partial [Bacteroidetes bacterium]|nr:hypothetical protein [Bacteroidota bacterium]
YMQFNVGNVSLHNIDIKSEYNAFLDKCVNVSLTQTWEYGEAKAKEDNSEVLRFIIFKNNHPIAASQVHQSAGVVTLNRGPLLEEDWKSNCSLGFESISCLFAYFVKQKSFRFHVRPTFMESHDTDTILRDIGFEPYGERSRKSIRINLRTSEDELRKNLVQKWRNQLNKSVREGVELEVTSKHEDIAYFISQYLESQKIKNYVGLSGLFLTAF